MPSRIDNIPPEKRGNPAWTKGGPSPNPGGRRKALGEIEDMIDAEFRTPETIRFALTRCKELGFGTTVPVVNPETGADDTIIVPGSGDPAFAKLFLDRVLGPVKEIEDIDLSNAPPEALEFIKSLKGN